MSTPRTSGDALTSPQRTGGLLALLEPGRKGSRVLQTLGALIGIALLVWAFSLVFSEDNVEARTKLANAPARQIVLLAAATCAGICMIGLTFWVTLLPIRRISLRNVITINAIAIFLTVLPFKLGFVSRIFLHHRIDGLRYKLIFAWTGAMAALGAASLVPLTVVSLWRNEVDSVWWFALGAGLVATHVVGWGISRWTKVGAWNGRFSRLILHADDFTSRPSILVMHAAARALEMAQLALRFSIAGAIILDEPLGMSQSIILASTFVFFSVVAPLGALGVREWGVTLVGTAVGLSRDPLMTVVLAVGVTEVVVAGGMALLGGAFLRPWRKRNLDAKEDSSTTDPSPETPDCSAPTSAT